MTGYLQERTAHGITFNSAEAAAVKVDAERNDPKNPRVLTVDEINIRSRLIGCALGERIISGKDRSRISAYVSDLVCHTAAVENALAAERAK